VNWHLQVSRVIVCSYSFINPNCPQTTTNTTTTLNSNLSIYQNNLKMTRGNAEQVKVHFKGKEDDYVVIVESGEAVRNWKGDRSIPLAQVVDGFKIFVTHKCVVKEDTSDTLQQY